MGQATPSPDTACGFDPETRFVRGADVLWRRVAGVILVRTVDNPEVVELSGTGLLLWLALHEPVTARELAADLAAAVGGAVDVVAADVQAALVELARRGFVTPGGAA